MKRQDEGSEEAKEQVSEGARGASLGYEGILGRLLL